MTTEQREYLMNLIEEYGEAEERFGDFCSNNNVNDVNDAYYKIVDFLDSICEV
jgi:hypothetical protein